MKNPQVMATLPCHPVDLKVTGRRSKQNERPRRHRCKECGRVYLIDVKGGHVNNIKSV